MAGSALNSSKKHEAYENGKQERVWTFTVDYGATKTLVRA